MTGRTGMHPHDQPLRLAIARLVGIVGVRRARAQLGPDDRV